jgi:hypothetical protein
MLGVLLILLLFVQAHSQTKSLPSWNDGPAKKGIAENDAGLPGSSKPRSAGASGNGRVSDVEAVTKSKVLFVYYTFTKQAQICTILVSLLLGVVLVPWPKRSFSQTVASQNDPFMIKSDAHRAPRL